MKYEPKNFRIDPIPEGQCSIDAGGNLCVRQSDLALVNIENGVSVLIDEMTMRLAIRRPRGGRSVAVNRFDRNGKGWGRIRISGPLKEMRLEVDAVKGRHEMTVKDDLLIIDLTGLAEGDEEEGCGREGKESRTAK